MICVFIICRNSRRLNQKWFYGEAGNQTCDPGLQGIALIHYTTGASHSTANCGRQNFLMLIFGLTDTYHIN